MSTVTIRARRLDVGRLGRQLHDLFPSRRQVAASFALVAAVSVGCAAPGSSPPKVTAGAPHVHAHSHDPGDHNHARGKMLLASDGSYNALLTSHLSAKDGNELDIFVEDKDGPYALDAKTLEAVARAGEADGVTVSFSCAPAAERPAQEALGKCSHFVAKTPWMSVGVLFRVETALPIGDRRVRMVWRDYEARKYAHHEE